MTSREDERVQHEPGEQQAGEEETGLRRGEAEEPKSRSVHGQNEGDDVDRCDLVFPPVRVTRSVQRSRSGQASVRSDRLHSGLESPRPAGRRSDRLLVHLSLRSMHHVHQRGELSFQTDTGLFSTLLILISLST